MGKADAIAYAVCHRIASHSFFIGDRQVPLCARCTGMYMGALLGMVYLQRKGKKGGMPSLKVSIVLGLFLVAFAIDGGNSYLHLLPIFSGLYEPQNWLRLLTGTGVGLGIASVLVPVVNQSIWQQYDEASALKSWRDFVPMVLIAGVLDLIVLSGNPLLDYPLVTLSAFTVLLILTLVYLVVWTMISKHENHFTSLRGLWVPFLAGFLTALMQIALFDAGRFWLTGTWAGFHL